MCMLSSWRSWSASANTRAWISWARPMSLSFSSTLTVIAFAPPLGSRNTRLALITFARFAAAISRRMIAAIALESNIPNPTNRKSNPHTRLPRLNFVSVSTLATLRNGMVLVAAPSGIRPNRVFGALYWIRVLDAAIEVLSQKMMTLGLNLSPTMFFSPGANVNSVMVCAFSDMCCLPSVRVAVNALRWEGTESSLVPLVGRFRPMSCPRRPAPIWRRYRVMLPLVASSGTGRDRMLVSRPCRDGRRERVWRRA